MRGWVVGEQKKNKKTQLPERVTHLPLSQALRARLAFTGCYYVNTRVRFNVL